MANQPPEALLKVAQQIPQMRENLEEAKDLIDALVETGKDTTRQQADYTNAKAELARWEKMLTKRGIEIPA